MVALVDDAVDARHEVDAVHERPADARPGLLSATTIAGLYQAQATEVGAAIELQVGGHFRYQLDYGAVQFNPGP